MFDAAFAFQSGTNGWGRLWCPSLDRRIMRIVAMRTIVLCAGTLPVRYALAVDTECPVPVPVGVASAAYEMGIIKVDRLVEQRSQIIQVLKMMTGMAPDPAVAMINFRIVIGVQDTNFRIRFHRGVALVAGIEKQVVLARHYLDIRRSFVPFEANAIICVLGMGSDRTKNQETYPNE